MGVSNRTESYHSGPGSHRNVASKVLGSTSGFEGGPPRIRANAGAVKIRLHERLPLLGGGNIPVDIAVVMADPGHPMLQSLFVAALWGEVQPIVSPDEYIQPASVA